MQTTTHPASIAQTFAISNKSMWAGRVLSGICVLFLLFDSIIHLMRIPPVAKALGELGFPMSLAVTLGIVELVCIALYVIPGTSVLGAILLTGYLGGAIATQLRVGNPLFGETLFPVYVGALAWGGLYLRDAQLRAMIPLRR